MTTTDEAAEAGATCVGCGNPVQTAGACDAGCTDEATTPDDAPTARP